MNPPNEQKPRELKIMPRYKRGMFEGYDVVSGSITMDEPETVYHVREVMDSEKISEPMPDTPEQGKSVEDAFEAFFTSYKEMQSHSSRVCEFSIFNTDEFDFYRAGHASRDPEIKVMREESAKNFKAAEGWQQVALAQQEIVEERDTELENLIERISEGDADTKRLEWMMESGNGINCFYSLYTKIRSYAVSNQRGLLKKTYLTPREAIDAAMAEEFRGKSS